jgi:hypothetical protein
VAVAAGGLLGVLKDGSLVHGEHYPLLNYLASGINHRISTRSCDLVQWDSNGLLSLERLNVTPSSAEFQPNLFQETD